MSLKLCYSPGACSLSPHIALCEAGLAHELVKVDLASKAVEGGGDFRKINPNGYVPALVLVDGTVLTEGPAILQYIADRVPERGLAPANGTLPRYQLQSLLNFIATELHKTCGPLFHPQVTEAARQQALSLLQRRLDFVEQMLADGRLWLMGAQFTVADGYLFTVLGWTTHLKIDLAPWPAIVQLVQRIRARPAVQAALRAEGLL